MGGFAPTIGILGTVIGLVRVLGNLSEPSELGAAIASAFTATLWGVMSANIFWIPISNKLKRLSDDEVRRKELAIEGLIAVQEVVCSARSSAHRLCIPFLAPETSGGDAKQAEADQREPATGRGGGMSRQRAHRPNDRRIEEEDHTGMERWLLTYADMITLLLALFVVLYALSSLNHVKYAQFAKGLNTSFNDGTSQPSSARTTTTLKAAKRDVTKERDLPRHPREAVACARSPKPGPLLPDVALEPRFTRTRRRPREQQDLLQQRLRSVIRARSTDRRHHRSDASEPPEPRQRRRLRRQCADHRGTVLEQLATLYSTGGRCRRTPASRHRPGVNPAQLYAVGFGQYHPVVPDDSVAHLAENRRVDIVISPTGVKATLP